MKLAEALHIRADLQMTIHQLEQRLESNAKVQEGDTPAENPEDLLKQLNTACDQLEQIKKKILRTNYETMLDGKPLFDKLTEKEVLRLKIGIIRRFLKEASEKVQRYNSTDIKVLSSINVEEKQKELDHLSKQLRLLDVEIQGMNWTTDLIED